MDAVQGLSANLSILNEAEADEARRLVDAGQAELFSEWPPAGEADEQKHAFFAQVRILSKNYPGGLKQYISNARRLLEAAAKGENSLEGWCPSVPTSGVELAVGSDACCGYERRGLEEVAFCSFVIPAGGLGERLGFHGVKFALPADIVTGWCVLDVYAAFLRAFEALSAKAGRWCQLPLVIMASADTYEGIKGLLAEKNYCGLAESQVTILLQEKVAALSSSSAKLAMESPFRISTKPHGHGDIHFLLHSAGLLDRWLDEGRRWVYFFQDTNTLYLVTLLSTLGVSASEKLEVNSVAMPRRAKEAVGAIAKLTHTDGRSIVVNVEYNQLEPLLLSTGHPEGDTNAPDGFSPYPGNQNGLVFALPEYVATLRRTQGQLPEFINPKFVDETRTAFKSPARLECMMQDYAKVLSSEAKVGYTRYPLEFGYFPCKNDIVTAAKLSAAGVPPHGAASAEAAVFHANCTMLRLLGAKVAEPTRRTWHGGDQDMGPAVVFAPNFVPCFSELKSKLPAPEKVRISSRSSLVVEGADICIEELDLDGALSVKAEPGVSLRVTRLSIQNAGCEFVALTPEEQQGAAPEMLRIRGYRLERREVKEVFVSEPGSYVLTDGELVRLDGCA